MAEAERREFPPEHKTAFEGLLYLGYLEAEVDIPGHKFVIRTLKTGEKLEVGSICRQFEKTYFYDSAFKAATVAASLVSIDAKPLIVGEAARGEVRAKYEYLVESWYDPVINHIYTRYQNLEQEMFDLLREMGLREQNW